MSHGMEKFLELVQQAGSVEVDGIFYGRGFSLSIEESATDLPGIVFDGKCVDNDHTIYEFWFSGNDLKEIQYHPDRDGWVVVKADETSIIKLYRNQPLSPDDDTGLFYQMEVADWEIRDGVRETNDQDTPYLIEIGDWHYGGIFIKVIPKEAGRGETLDIAVEINKGVPCLHLYSGPNEDAAGEQTCIVFVEQGDLFIYPDRDPPYQVVSREIARFYEHMPAHKFSGA